MRAKVSVCIPVYNVANYMERCARTLFGQTLAEIEYIFVDDCSPDDSIGILQKVLTEYPHRQKQVQIIRHETNRGLAAARSTALKHAGGEYIIHCDSDDWVELDMYEKMYLAATTAAADICYCPYILDDGGKRRRVVNIPECQTAGELLHLILQNNRHWNLWAKLVKAEIARTADFYRPEHICFGEDLLFSAQMLSRAGRVVCCPVPLYHYFNANTGSYTRTFHRTSRDQLAEVVTFLEQQLPPQYDLTACRAEVLFKDVFYALVTRQEFRDFSCHRRRKILAAPGFPIAKKVILAGAFVNYPLTAWLLKLCRCR